MANPLLYPNVTSLPGQVGGASESQKVDRLNREQELKGKGDFSKELDRELTQGLKGGIPTELGQVQVGSPLTSPVKPSLKFSSHATQRLKERKIELDQATMTKVSDAVERADSKGVQDTLVLTGKAALIVNVPNRTVVTAMDRGSLDGNVFTNIDGAVII